MTKRMMTGALLLTLAATACENAGPTGAEGDARMQVAMQGDDATNASRSGESSSSAGSVSGEIDVEARVYAQTSAGTWVELTRGRVEETVDASGRAGAEVVSDTRVQSNSFTRVRVEFERVDADVDGGVTIGGSLLTGSVKVDFGGESKIVVERSVSFTASSSASSQVLVNLNADAWLNRASATTRTVSRADFASAVMVTAS